MKKYILLLLSMVIILSLATITQAQPVLKLDVVLNNQNPHQVIYVATLIPAVSGAIIDFYTEPIHDVMPPFPTKYVGSSTTDNTGVAKFIFQQDSGPWEAGAIWRDGVNAFRSNLVDYTIPY